MLERHRQRRLLDQFTIGLFVGTLVVTLGLTVWHANDNIIVSEKRSRAARPQLSVKTWFRNAFQPAAERYINDRFGGRDTLVRWNNLIHLAWFHLSPVKTTMAGNQNWLLFTGEGTTDDYRNLRLLSNTEVASLRQRLQSMQDTLAAQGTRFAVVIAPNAQTIYPEAVPSADNRIRPESRFDQVIAAMKETNVTIVDPRPSLLARKSAVRVYEQTDSHWNDEGAYVAYQMLMQSLADGRTALQPHPLADYQRRTFPTQGGDLATSLALADVIQEQEIRLIPTFATRAYQAEAAYPGAKLKKPVKATQIDDPTLPTAVIFQDSFTNALEPFLAEHFRRAIFVHSRDLIPSVIAQEHPEVVILEIIERQLPLLANGDNSGNVGQ